MTEGNDISRGKNLELKKVAELALSAHLIGELPPQELAQKLATHMEPEAARDGLDQFVRDGRITREEVEPMISELQSTRSVENHIAAATGVTAGGGAALTMVSASGTVAGLSASGITSGLAALGGFVGGGMAAGLLVTAGGAIAAGTATFWVTKRIVRQSKRWLDAGRLPPH